MTIDLWRIYTSAPYGDGAAVLRCTQHPEWEADIDGTPLPDVVEKATEHARAEDHGGGLE